jgi:hypothetical protein
MTVVPAGPNNGRAPLRGYAEWRPQARARETLGHVEEVFERYADHLPLTARQVFYSLVAAGHIDKTEQGYDRLCDVLKRGRRAGLIAFGDIRDDGVIVQSGEVFDGVEDFEEATARRAKRYRRDRQAGQPYRIELWCEAAGMLGQLARVAGAYSVPVFSASGFASLSAVRLIAERALDWEHVPTLLLHVGDFDPSGESIFTALSEDAAAFVRADRVLATTRLEAQRVALTAGQVQAYALPTAPAKASDARSRAWTGGTCQLEALAPDDLAQIVRDAIEEHLDRDEYHETLVMEQDDRAELLGLPRGDS